MAVVFSEADSEVYDLLKRVLDEHFSMVANLNPVLRIQIRMAEDPRSSVGLKYHGHPVAGKIKIVGADERALWIREGGSADTFPDLRLFLDADRWRGLSDRQKEALIWHECNHIQPVRDKKSGELRFDPYGRIKLRLRLDDWMLTGFAEAVSIFGADALEHESLSKVLDLLNLPSDRLPFGSPAPDPSKKKSKASRSSSSPVPAPAEVA